jgi:hypothetical protein
MSRRQVVTTLIVLLTAIVGLIGTAINADAAPRITSGPPREATKVILGDTSIDGPAITSLYAPATLLAWTGDDPDHHLNIIASNDGLRYNYKYTLSDTSLWRPAVAFIDSGRGAPYGTIVLAWTGTDPNHTLNVEFIKTPDFTVTKKIIFWGETSFTAPALATVNGDINSDIFLSWAGTDSAHTVNVMRLSTNSDQTNKTTLWGWSSISRPNLATDHAPNSTNALILSWTGTNNRIYFANSADKIHWTMPDNSPLSQQTAWAPTMMSSVSPDYWLAWAGNGTSSTGNLNVQYTQSYPTWNDANSSASLDETAISSPALIYNGDGDTREVLLAWTGTDYYHHLNVAVITI